MYICIYTYMYVYSLPKVDDHGSEQFDDHGSEQSTFGQGLAEMLDQHASRLQLPPSPAGPLLPSLSPSLPSSLPSSLPPLSSFFLIPTKGPSGGYPRGCCGK